MKIAIVGAGLAGLALAIECKKANPQSNVMLFDPLAPNQRTSALAQLLYPFAGLYSKLNWQGEKSFKKSVAFLEEAQKYATIKLFDYVRLLKIALSSKQITSFKEASAKYPEITFTAATDYGAPGIWISNSIQVEAIQYLQALEKWGKALGVTFLTYSFTEKMKKEFDQVIYTSGHACQKLFPQIELTLLKGQALILKRPANFFLDYNLIIQPLHVLQSLDQQWLYVGNTFERQPIDSHPDKNIAFKLLWPEAKKYFPMLSEDLVVDVKSGIRLNAPSRLPIIAQPEPKVWVFSALGSKGLLYHAHLAELLTKQIYNPDDQLVPQDLMCKVC